MMKKLGVVAVGDRKVLPLVEGGKGVSASNHMSSGAWAAAGGVGTISAVFADSYDSNGEIVPQIYTRSNRRGRHDELIRFAIDGGIQQVRRAYEIAEHTLSRGYGALNINVLWEMGGAQEILTGILDGAPGLVNGVTCGAGMPYGLAAIAASFDVFYYPIVSSARAFSALWKRSYSKDAAWLGGVVYEDPWLAGGHNGISNAEDPCVPQAPYARCVALRTAMRFYGIADTTPIIMAGGVWRLDEWTDWIDNVELGTVVFQLGTRPLLTQESPIPPSWKRRLLDVRAGDISLNKFSPTGFHSSAVRNSFLHRLEALSERQLPFSLQPTAEHHLTLDHCAANKPYFVDEEGQARARSWHALGYTQALRTPDHTLVFETPTGKAAIQRDQSNCMGCLSHCAFSAWKDSGTNSTGRLADPRSFCIQKTLQDIAHGGDPDHNLMFGGQSSFRFSTDPFYANGHVPTVAQLVERLMTGA